MRAFTRNEILRYETGDRSGYIPACGKKDIPFSVTAAEGPVSHCIRLVGETDYYWRWRTEWGAPYAIAMGIDDALTTQDTYGERYALQFPCNGEDAPRNAYLKFYQSDFKPGEKYTFAIAAKAEEFHRGSSAEMVLELYYAKEGRHPNDVFDAPDQLVTIDFPEGSYDWTVLSKEFTMPQNAVCGILRMGVRGCTGKLKVGSPRLSVPGGESIVPPLAPTQDRRPQFNYLGENLSRRDWLECALLIDGKEVWRGERYSSIVRRAEYSFNVGTIPPGDHTLTLQLLDDYATAVGFVLQGVEVHEFGAHDFELIGAPETAQEGEPYTALIRTNQANVSLRADGREFLFAEAGLHAVEFAPLSEERHHAVIVSATHQDGFQVERVGKPERPILLGTGDFVYIPHTQEDMERYLEWYVGNRIGNCICFRHSYRWGGSRGMNAQMWKKTIPLLNALRLHYTVMVDGREVPGMNSTPTEDILQGPYYLGRRSHENDGSLCYWANCLWGTDEFREPYGDILSRGVNAGGIQPHVRPKRTASGKTWWFFDPDKAQDMKEAAEYFVENLKDAKGQSTRHSGPSALFRYFFQAGYDCLLAEQMYGPEEVILSSLRGASTAYGKKDFGTHLAVQWSSEPLDCQEHADRYFLSLATSYMNGATDINTEEGLWRMESNYADHDRFSHNCVIHRQANDRFRKFLERHPRHGRIVVPNALIQGRYDGWRCFGRENLWRNHGEQWTFGKAEESFDLLSTFYPRNVLNSIYVVPCPNEPQGWYSGTPFGYADLTPWEVDWTRYPAVAMMGWHTYQAGDAQKMLEYVKQGGRLLLCRRHLNTALKHTAAPVYPADEPALTELLGDDWRQDGAMRLRKIGQGVVRYFPCDLWPAEEPLRQEYLVALKDQAREVTSVEEAKGWIRANEDVEFAAYELPDGTRQFYLLNIRWWDRKDATVTLVKGGKNTEIVVPFGEIISL